MSINAGKSVLVIFISLALILSGCGKPSGDPAETLKVYEEHILNGRYDSAYGLMTKKSQEKIPKDKFITWRQLYNFENGKVKSYSIEKTGEGVDKEIDGVKYKDFAQLKLVEIYTPYTNNRETPTSYEIFVVNDDGNWRIHRTIEIDQRLAGNYASLGWMYLYGQGKEKNLNEAITAYKKAINLYSDDSDFYYFLSIAYEMKGDINQSFDLIQKGLTKIKNDNPKQHSKLLTRLGNLYANRYDFGSAISTYNKALKLDPDNEYAKSNLSRIVYR